MGFGLNSIKRDFAKHRHKAMVLGVLSVVMVLLVVKAVFEMRPRTVAASTTAAAAGEKSGKAEKGESAADAEARIKESQELWKILREQHGVSADVAFTFDPAYFPVDPKWAAERAAQRAEHVVPVSVQPAVNTEEQERAARVNDIREQARMLIVHSTIVGNGTAPVAVVNKSVLTVGDRISGFEITAIRAREVEFKKDGITLAVKMAEDASVQ